MAEDTKITVYKSYEISMGHRVFEENHPCSHLHGHDYIICFYCRAPLPDGVALTKPANFDGGHTRLGNWLYDNWDRRTIIYSGDPWIEPLMQLDGGLIRVDFNPTPANIADHLLNVVGPAVLRNTGILLNRVTVRQGKQSVARAELTREPYTGG